MFDGFFANLFFLVGLLIIKQPQLFNFDRLLKDKQPHLFEN